MTDCEPGYSLGMKQNTTFLHFQNESDTFCTKKLAMDCVGEMEKQKCYILESQLT